MRNNYTPLEIITVVLSLAVAIILGKLVFEAVMATDWPDWVKYLILK